ncbi:hypothetical protein CXR25_14100 [Brevibacterium aurantiacum]|uniref:recombinase family protein n=1 Tax=Brevibacterium aurantiacum TaxID=273384 RepID=UPI000F653B35|nr:recombinase family protein [Brevibacterium aurantiacum]AZL13828.1 hypothetical protein CXR25_14100 [Brevibacterium aurantiacum]
MTIRAALYLRQSTHREESISLELQEAACRRHCEERGYQVVMVESDPGISGRTFNRPAVKRVMEAVEAREVDAVILWKWSRLSRSRRDWAIAADRVDVAGGRIESATEDIDVSTSHGRLARGMMVEFAAFESERIGDQWKEAHQRRVSMGLPANGKPRFGYRRLDEGFEPDPETGPVLADMYRRYISGESFYALVKTLNDNSIDTVPGYGTSGGAWSQRSLQRVLDSGFGAGLIRSHEEYFPGAHEPIIDEDEWKDYRAARDRRRVHRGSERSTYLLSGMVRCHCGSSMVAGQFGWKRVPKFRCKAAAEKRAHDGGYVSAHVLDDEVKAWLRGIVSDLSEVATAEAGLQSKRSQASSNLSKLGSTLTRTEQAITRLTVSYAEGILDLEAYRSATKELEQKRDGLMSTINSAESERRAIPVSLEVVQSLLDDWDIIGIEQRREMLRGLVRHVVVKPQRPKSNVTVVPIWDAGV